MMKPNKSIFLLFSFLFLSTMERAEAFWPFSASTAPAKPDDGTAGQPVAATAAGASARAADDASRTELQDMQDAATAASTLPASGANASAAAAASAASSSGALEPADGDAATTLRAAASLTSVADGVMSPAADRPRTAADMAEAMVGDDDDDTFLVVSGWDISALADKTRLLEQRLMALRASVASSTRQAAVAEKTQHAQARMLENLLCAIARAAESGDADAPSSPVLAAARGASPSDAAASEEVTLGQRVGVAVHAVERLKEVHDRLYRELQTVREQLEHFQAARHAGESELARVRARNAELQDSNSTLERELAVAKASLGRIDDAREEAIAALSEKHAQEVRALQAKLDAAQAAAQQHNHGAAAAASNAQQHPHHGNGRGNGGKGHRRH